MSERELTALIEALKNDWDGDFLSVDSGSFQIVACQPPAILPSLLRESYMELAALDSQPRLVQIASPSLRKADTETIEGEGWVRIGPDIFAHLIDSSNRQARLQVAATIGLISREVGSLADAFPTKPNTITTGDAERKGSVENTSGNDTNSALAGIARVAAATVVGNPDSLVGKPDFVVEIGDRIEFETTGKVKKRVAARVVKISGQSLSVEVSDGQPIPKATYEIDLKHLVI